MARRRRRHEEAQRFKMRERLIAIGDDYWVEDQAGDRVFKVNGKVARVRDTRVLEERDGNRRGVRPRHHGRCRRPRPRLTDADLEVEKPKVRTTRTGTLRR